MFDPTLTSETIFAFTYIDFPNQFEDRNAISRQALGYPYQGVFGESNDQIPSIDPGGWGNNGPIFYNPGGFDPILFATKWQYAFTQNITKVWGTHTAKLGFFWENVRNNQPGNNNSTATSSGTWGTGQHREHLCRPSDRPHRRVQREQANVLHDIVWDRFEVYAHDSWKMSPGFTLNYGARVLVLRALDRTTRATASPPGSTGPVRRRRRVWAGQFPGVYWNAIDSGVPLSGVDTTWYVSPRLGFAWDVTGTGETVLRGGGGMYLWHDPQGVWAGLVDLPNGVEGLPGVGNFTLAYLDALGGGNITFGGQAIDKDDNKQPKTYTWSLTLNQKLPWSMNIELGYVGNKQNDQDNNNIANINAVPLGRHERHDPDGAQQRPTVRSAYPDLNVCRHTMFSNYHGLQALLARQRGSFNFTLAYTFSKTTGLRWRPWPDGRLRVLDTIVSPLPRLHLRRDRRRPDARGHQQLQLAAARAVRRRGRQEHVLGGWQLAGILSYVSGAPLPYGNRVNFNLQGTNEVVDASTPGLLRVARGPGQPVVTCDPRRQRAERVHVQPGLLRGAGGGDERQLQPALHEGAEVLERRPVALQELRPGRRQEAPAAAERLQRAQPPDRLPGRGHQPHAPLRERRPAPNFGRLRPGSTTTTSSDGASSSSRCGSPSRLNLIGATLAGAAFGRTRFSLGIGERGHDPISWLPPGRSGSCPRSLPEGLVLSRRSNRGMT